MPLKLTTYYHGKDIPDLPGNNTFHSKELFQIYEATPGYSPLLIVATEDGNLWHGSWQRSAKLKNGFLPVL